jgi:hypothetical protein
VSANQRDDADRAEDEQKLVAAVAELDGVSVVERSVGDGGNAGDRESAGDGRSAGGGGSVGDDE